MTFILAEAQSVDVARSLAIEVGFPVTIRPAYGITETSRVFSGLDDNFDTYIELCLILSPITTVGIMRDEKC